jgi:SulP family sulfate permease
MNLPKNLSGDFWGGLAAMLVALPSAIAFGVTIYAPLGSAQAAQGALAILGAMALGLVAASLGGAPRLISAPCAPAAAVLSAFAIETLRAGHDIHAVLLMLTMVGLMAGVMQVGFGVLRLGKLIEYMPYPVVSGYLSGVAHHHRRQCRSCSACRGSQRRAGAAPAAWDLQSAVGAVTAGVMIGAPRLIKIVPAAILGLLAGVLAYFGLALMGAAPLGVEANPLVIGPLSMGGAGGGRFGHCALTS